MSSCSTHEGCLIAARHGEREDYVQRDNGGNWIPTTQRPWDPPLSAAGHEQVRALGRRVARRLRENMLPPVTAVYSSPLLRCCQTAAGAIIGLEEDGAAAADALKIRIEPGIVESLCEKWYRSWCLPGSDGTWGYVPSVAAEGSSNKWEVDVSTINSNAKIPATDLFLFPADVEERLKESCGDSIKTRQGGIIDMEYTTPAISLIEEGFCWNNFESRKMQLSRAEAVTKAMAARHPGETILLLSHGSPVTHIFEAIANKD